MDNPVENGKIEVLGGQGYVRLLDNMGDDLSVVNAARVSFDKESDELDSKNKNLIDFLVKNKHDSVLRHQVLSFEIYAPLEIKNQFWKHVIASSQIDDQYGHNETSRRYITEDPVFYLPEVIHSTPENQKQGHGEPHPEQEAFKAKLENVYTIALENYENALADGVAAQEARLLLPAYALMVRWRWTVSLNAVLNFVSLRLAAGAQLEATEYAAAVNSLIYRNYPYTARSWSLHRV